MINIQTCAVLYIYLTSITPGGAAELVTTHKHAKYSVLLPDTASSLLLLNHCRTNQLDWTWIYCWFEPLFLVTHISHYIFSITFLFAFSVTIWWLFCSCVHFFIPEVSFIPEGKKSIVVIIVITPLTFKYTPNLNFSLMRDRFYRIINYQMRRSLSNWY